MTSTPSLALGLPEFSYADLHNPDRLRDLFFVWRQELGAADAALAARYDAYLATQGKDLGPEATSELLVQVAPAVSAFVARLLAVGVETHATRDKTTDEMVLVRFKD